LDEWFLLRSTGQRFVFSDAHDGGQHLPAHVGLIGSYGQAQLRVVGDDVVFRARPDVTDGDYGHLSWRYLARDDGLQSEDRSGGDHDGIDGRLRRCTVAAFAVDGDAQRIGI